MHEILRHVGAGSSVLDLGSGTGSFDPCGHPFRTIRLDLEPPPPIGRAFSIRGDAGRLPFAAGSFDAVVSNHSLEHVRELDACLREIGRILTPGGAVFIAVPGSETITDRLYRWLADGGGHVNAFPDAKSLVRRLELATGLPVLAVRPLLTSLSFLNRKNGRSRIPRKAALIGYGYATSLHLINLVLRTVDRVARTKTALYGWAIYLGNVSEEVAIAPWANVCIRCGGGHPAEALLQEGRIRRRWGVLRCYTCPSCGTWNIFYPDRRFAHLR